VDERLMSADPALVRQVIARTCLAAPAIDAELGEIRLEPHQRDAAARLLALLHEWNGALLADATGLGKTFVAIALARVLSPAVVAAPASLRSMWRDSLGRAHVPATVITYEAMSRQATCPDRPALLILDEAHHARNPATRRYAALADLAWGTKVLLLSATPVHNRGRDLRALLALFIGSRAYSMSDSDVGVFIVRRSAVREVSSRIRLPEIGRPRWLEVPGSRETLEAITSLPRAVPAADGGTAHALLTLGLIRAWVSSEHALRETLRRRLRRVAAFTAALESGQRPGRRDLNVWPVVGDAVQLGFPDLFTTPDARGDLPRLRDELEAHASGVRALLTVLDSNGGASDSARLEALRHLRSEHEHVPIVAFTQFADTAHAFFRSCMVDGGVALVTGRGARVASGRVTSDEIVRGFDVIEGNSAALRALPLVMLIATDVLSEGLSLRRAGVLVHLDLPWTAARLEQRVGRLRRFGSPHRCIAMYAIGPPVGARELVHVIRALQRKVRLSSGVVGATELEATLPLIGSRMNRAISNTVARGSTQCTEILRAALMNWAEGRDSDAPNGRGAVALACVLAGDTMRLLGVVGSRVTERPCELLDAVQALSRGEAAIGIDLVAPFERIVRGWMDQQRGRELARTATNAPSPAHTETLRRLQVMLQNAPRAERISAGARVERCRELVASAIGAGAEAALQKLLDDSNEVSLDALERLLEPRVSVKIGHDSARVIAILASDERRERMSGLVTDGSFRPAADRPR
jgi:hypothetical protein